MKRTSLAAAITAAVLLGWLLLRTPAPEATPGRARPMADAGDPGSGKTAEAASGRPADTAPAASDTANVPSVTAPGNGAPGLTPPGTAAPPATAANPSDRRPWDPAWLQSYAGAATPTSVRFELLNGEIAEGTATYIQETPEHVVYVAGHLKLPETGTFFFRRQSLPGIVGTHVGVVQLPGSARAYRLEPSKTDGSPELVSRKLDEVVCVKYRMPRAGAILEASTPDPEEAPVIDIGQHPSVPIPDYQNGVPVLESLPGARGVVYLDFDGETTTEWDGELIVARRPNFTASQIREVWRYVCADYTSFNINITTDLRVFQLAPENSRIRVIITPTTDAAPGAGGVAFLQSWNWTGDTPCWAFGSGVKEAAEQIAHEVGHTLGLSHDGSTTTGEEYYGGHGSGETGWAPIMGVGYYQPVSQWSKGEYAGANNREDDLRMITEDNNAVDYRADDFGALFSSAAYLEIFAGGAFTNRGFIERNTDVDAFRFTTQGGRLELTARPAAVSPNLALRLDLTDAADQVLLTVNPGTTLRAVMITNNLPAGDYAIKVRGAGRGANASVGFSAYSSLGFYQLTGTVAGAVQPIRVSVEENTPDGTLVSDLNSFASGSGTRVFVATGGSGLGPFALSEAGLLTVAQSSLLNFETREQYELQVDIQYPDNPALNESNRRVVVRIEDVNELPLVSAGPMTIYNRTRADTIVGVLKSSDPDLYTRLRYAISAGNEAGWFAVNGSGELRLTRDLDSGPTTFNLQVDAWDAGNPVLTNSVPVTVEVLATPVGLRPGAIEYAVYEDIPGAAIRDLTADPSFPASPSSRTLLSEGEIPVKRGDQFGGVLRGYFLPPVSGSYVFGIAGDDATELRLGTSDQPETAVRIASNSTFSDRRRWTQFPSQRSRPQVLEQGKAYYLEARLKEDSGDDHLSIAWQNADAGAPALQLIPGRYLAPFETKTGPRISTNELRLHRNAFAGARFGRVEATDAGGNTAFNYELLSSTRPGLATLGFEDGWFRVGDANQLATTSGTDVKLRVRVSIPGGLSSTGTITCRLLAPAAMTTNAPVAEIFTDIGPSTGVNTMTNNPAFPGRPSELRPFDASAGGIALVPNSGDRYGTRIRGVITAPATGSYRFYIASDDSSELWLGTSANPSSIQPVARVSGAVPNRSWTTQPGQRSAAISLTARGQYYLEVRHKEGTGDDHLALAWTRPTVTSPVVIPLNVLGPVDLGIAPTFTNASATVSPSAPVGSPVIDLNADDSPLEQLAWRIAGGNAEGIFSLDVDEGILRVANSAALASSAATSWGLTVEVQDSGYGDRFPRRQTAAQVTITRAQTGSPFDTWAAANGIPGAKPGDDADGDGVINQLEFAFGGNPTVADAAVMSPSVSLLTENGSTQVLLKFRRRTNATASGLAYLTHATPTLPGTWVPALVAGEVVLTSGPGLPPGYEEVTQRLSDPVPSGGAERFLRVEVTLTTAAAAP